MINENKINFYQITEMLTCMDCPYIPSIKINTNQHSINVECQNDIKVYPENNIISGHFHNKILLKDYLSKLEDNYKNNKKKCSLCNNNINIDNIYYCSFCRTFLCNKCLNNIHIIEKNDHPSIKLNTINTNCCVHNKIYKYYCKNCFRNICEDCLNRNNLHKKHEIIDFDDILIDEKYLREIEEEINEEENNLKNMDKKFEQYMNFLRKKYDEYIKLRQDEINLKRNILYSYDKYKNNYNSIMNVKKLKFDYFKFNKEKEKEEKKNKKNINKFKDIKKLINELILFEETKLIDKEKEEEKNKKTEKNENEINITNELNKKKEKDSIKCYKENVLIKSSKYEIVNKITTKNIDAEYVLPLKNNKLLIAYTNRTLIIYNKNYLKNSLVEFCKLSLSNTKSKTVRGSKNFKGIYQLKNEDILISMIGLSNFILNINYETKTFIVVQEFSISKGLKINNPLFINLPQDPNNYNDIFPKVKEKTIFNNNNINNNINNDDINQNLNINNIINNNFNAHIIIRNNNQNNRINTDNNNNIIFNNNNLNNDNNRPNNIVNNMNINNNRNRIYPHGIVQRLVNRIGVPINHHPLPNNVIHRVNNHVLGRRKTLVTLVPLPNDDLLAISSIDCWILRKNSIKYIFYKDELIVCDNILLIKKACPISQNEFMVEISIRKKRTQPHIHVLPPIKSHYVYIFFDLNYTEICRKSFDLLETFIRTDNDYIYINDSRLLLLMNKKNKEVINIIDICSIGPVFPIRLNKSFIIQEKNNNAVVEYRIIDNEVVRSEELIINEKVKLISSLDDDSHTLIMQYKNEALLFLQ